MAEAAAEGKCRLTNSVGRFARSHIIPKALTDLDSKGERRVEVGIGLGIKKRFDSWFDLELCTHEGEKILSEIDTAAIQMLREHQLIWSSWDGEILPRIDFEIGDAKTVPNFRRIRFRDPRTLQLFFLSLLWRAAASKRSEFMHVILSDDEIEDLRKRVCSKSPGLTSDYPVHLQQVTTLGTKHNRAPLMEEMSFALTNEAERKVSYVRFYFDGLVAIMFLFRGRNDAGDHLKLSVADGANGETIVMGRPFEDSRTSENIKTMVRVVSREIALGHGHRRKGKGKK
jgi:hypothetical protein